MCRDGLQVANGLATFGEDELRALRRLDEVLLARAHDDGAREMAFPALTAASMLDRIDYFSNFPHLALAAAPLRRECLPDLPVDRSAGSARVSSRVLADADYFLPSAACYPIYAHLREQVLPQLKRVTTVQRCFRNEDRYEDLARLWAFTMREFVAVGPQDGVRQFLAEHKAWIMRFAEGADIALSVQVATDPFFERAGQRARMQQLFPVKEEFVFEETVAVASVNFHRNFFAERWGIRTADGRHAFSGCVAFGLERWLHALGRRYQHDHGAMLRAIDAAAANADAGRGLRHDETVRHGAGEVEQE